jgi:hypothetical protein
MWRKLYKNMRARFPLLNPLPQAGEEADESLREFHINHPLRNLLFALILTGIAAGLGYLSMRYHLQRDVTYNTINSLAPASVDVLKRLDGPVSVTVYATGQDPQHGDIRKIVSDFVSLYQRYKPDIKLVFIDPARHTEQARAAQIRFNGEMVVEYAGRSEHLTRINESILTGTLLRLAHTRNQVVMYLDGHGEPKLDGIANYDLGSVFGAKLRQNGFRLGSLNLALAQEVPDNASVLVLTQPQLDLMPGEVDKLLRYIEHGGNLLWLVDQGPLHGLERLAEKLDLQLPPGIVIDPAASAMNAPATWSLGATYPPHPVTRNFNLITAFPDARPLLWNGNPAGSTDSKLWQRRPLVEVAPRGWVSRKEPKGKAPVFDKQHDIPGPVVIALALQRHINNREQRIVVVGDGAFLANSFAGNGGNVDLGVNIVNWLASEDKLITIQPRAARDSQLIFSKIQLGLVSGIFLLALPLLLAGVGIFIWRRRRA